MSKPEKPYRSDLKNAIEILTVARRKEESMCNSWTKSDDRGACTAYKVHPISRILEFLEAQLEGSRE